MSFIFSMHKRQLTFAKMVSAAVSIYLYLFRNRLGIYINSSFSLLPAVKLWPREKLSARRCVPNSWKNNGLDEVKFVKAISSSQVHTQRSFHLTRQNFFAAERRRRRVLTENKELGNIFREHLRAEPLLYTYLVACCWPSFASTHRMTCKKAAEKAGTIYLWHDRYRERKISPLRMYSWHSSWWWNPRCTLAQKLDPIAQLEHTGYFRDFRDNDIQKTRCEQW